VILSSLKVRAVLFSPFCKLAKDLCCRVILHNKYIKFRFALRSDDCKMTFRSCEKCELWRDARLGMYIQMFMNFLRIDKQHYDESSLRLN
jgi:hypothetical protein